MKSFFERFKPGTRFRRLFFYSSRQIARRPRMYLSVFVTSVILVTLVMTALMLFESYYLRSVELDAAGTYSASILSQPNDLREKIAGYDAVKQVWAIPWTSKLASSVDASAPGKLVVETDEIDSLLGVRWIWGGPPADGEIAVPKQLYKSSRWLMAGEENELWFKAAEMVYEPMKISGIFSVFDESQNYILTTAATARKIDRGTGAHPKFDHYIVTKHETELQVAKVVREILTDNRIGDTEEQQKNPGEYNDFSRLSGTAKILEEYINNKLLENRTFYGATPVVLWCLPVIAVAALILAAFMMNWTENHSAELGVLGAVGATRADLGFLVSGQVLIVTTAACIVVVPLACLIALHYVNAFNAAIEGTGFAFAVPWRNLLKAALWFVLLSVLLTILGVLNLTRADPFALISGTFRKRSLFVKRTSKRLRKARDRIRTLAVVQSLRRWRTDLIPAILTALTSLLVGGVLLLAVFVKILTGSELSRFTAETPADSVIYAANPRDILESHSPLYRADADRLRGIPGIERIAVSQVFTGKDYGYPDEKNGSGRAVSPRVRGDGGWEFISVAVVDRDELPLYAADLSSFDVDAFFADECAIVISETGYFGGSLRQTGETITFSAETSYMGYRPVFDRPEDTETALKIVSVQPPNRISLRACLLIPRSAAERIGFVSADAASDSVDAIYVDYDKSLSDEETRKIVEAISNDPVFMRYTVNHMRVKEASTEKTSAAAYSMLLLFGSMLYITFCMTSLMNANIKAARSRREWAILRQIGADDRDIKKTVRVGVSIVSLFVASLIALAAVLIAWNYLSSAMQELNIARDRFPGSYPPEKYAELRSGYFMVTGIILAVSVASLPIQLITHFTSLAGAWLPTRRALKESVVEGIRKDTD